MSRCARAVVVLSLLMIGTLVSRGAADEMSFLSFGLQDCERARLKIETVSYRYEWRSKVNYDMQGANLPSEVVRGPRLAQMHISGREIKKLQWRQSETEHRLKPVYWRYSETEQQSKQVYLPSRQTREQDRVERAIFNDDCVVSWHVGNAYAYQFDHESPDAMSDIAEAHTAMQSIEPLECGFGPSGYTLRALYRKMKDKTPFRGELTMVDGKTVYRISQFSSRMTDPNRPSCVYIIDPEQGNLMTSLTAYYEDGSVRREETVTAEKLPEADIWYPIHVEQKGYRRAGETTEYLPRLSKTVSMTLSDVKINEPVDDEQFTIDALNITDDVCLMRQPRDGQVIPMLKKQGVWQSPSSTKRFRDN